jgi:hypothetical protein
MAGPTSDSLTKKVDRLQKRIDDLERRSHIKDLAEIQVHIFEENALGRAEKWLMTARNIGAAYGNAARNVREALTKSDSERFLETSEFFSVLTVLSAGTLTWVWEANQLDKIGKLLGPVLRDSYASALGESLSAIGPLANPPDPSRDPVSKDPQEFETDLKNRVSGFKVGAHEYIAKIWDNIRTASAESWDQVQVDKFQKNMANWLQEATNAGILAISANEQRTIDAMAYEFERGFWRQWILGLVKKTQEVYGDSEPTVRSEYEAIHTGSPVAVRLKKLGILKEAGVEITRYHDSVEEDRPLLAWARDKYKPNLFTSV